LNDQVLPESTPPDYKFEYVDISNVEQNYISNDLELYTFKEAPSRARRLAEPGDLIVSTVRTYLRAIAQVKQSEHNRVYSTGFAVLHPNQDRADSRYLSYVLTSDVVVDEIIATSTGVSYPAIQGSELHRLRVPFHSLETQRRIADYLDRETGQIDAMMQRLDEIAKAIEGRRTSVILDAIESSLSIAIGLMVDVTLGKMLQTSQKSKTDRLKPYLRAAHVQPKGKLDTSIGFHEMWFSESEQTSLDLRQGDAVVVEGGVGGYGRAAYIAEDLTGVGFQNSIIRLRGERDTDAKYLSYALVAARSTGQIEQACLNAAMPHFTAEKVGRFRVPFHEPHERAQIADHLDDVTSKIDAMLAKVAQLKDLLTERRAALITDVVTGRKDVA
jgi:type I restriction enzyme S subunit